MKSRDLQQGGSKAVIVMAFIETSLVREQEIDQDFRTRQLGQRPCCCFTDEEVIDLEQSKQIRYVSHTGFRSKSLCRFDARIDIRI